LPSRAVPPVCPAPPVVRGWMDRRNSGRSALHRTHASWRGSNRFTFLATDCPRSPTSRNDRGMNASWRRSDGARHVRRRCAKLLTDRENTHLYRTGVGSLRTTQIGRGQLARAIRSGPPLRMSMARLLDCSNDLRGHASSNQERLFARVHLDWSGNGVILALAEMDESDYEFYVTNYATHLHDGRRRTHDKVSRKRRKATKLGRRSHQPRRLTSLSWSSRWFLRNNVACIHR